VQHMLASQYQRVYLVKIPGRWLSENFRLPFWWLAALSVPCCFSLVYLLLLYTLLSLPHTEHDAISAPCFYTLMCLILLHTYYYIFTTTVFTTQST
jgi:hypothetical protein